MAKQLDPNHLSLMTATRDAVEALRTIISDLEPYAVSKHGVRPDAVPVLQEDLRAVCDRLRLTLKGRIG